MIENTVAPRVTSQTFMWSKKQQLFSELAVKCLAKNPRWKAKEKRKKSAIIVWTSEDIFDSLRLTYVSY